MLKIIVNLIYLHPISPFTAFKKDSKILLPNLDINLFVYQILLPSVSHRLTHSSLRLLLFFIPSFFLLVFIIIMIIIIIDLIPFIMLNPQTYSTLFEACSLITTSKNSSSYLTKCSSYFYHRFKHKRICD